MKYMESWELVLRPVATGKNKNKDSKYKHRGTRRPKPMKHRIFALLKLIEKGWIIPFMLMATLAIPQISSADLSGIPVPPCSEGQFIWWHQGKYQCVASPGGVTGSGTQFNIPYWANFTTLGDIPSQSPAGYTLTSNGVGIAPSFQLPPTQGNLTYYLTPTNSDITNGSAINTQDLKMLTPPYTPSTNINIANNFTADVVLVSWATEPHSPSLTFIPAGQYIFHIHTQRLSGNRT